MKYAYYLFCALVLVQLTNCRHESQREDKTSVEASSLEKIPPTIVEHNFLLKDIFRITAGRNFPEDEPPLKNEKEFSRPEQKPLSIKEQQPAKRKLDYGIPVICYHQNYNGNSSFEGFNVSPAMLEKQLQILKEEGFETVTLDDFYQAISGNPPENLPERPVLITFDDGLTSNLTNVLPLFRKYNFRGVAFIYPTMVNANKKKYKYSMDWNQVQALARSGHFEIASHTFSHPMLPRLAEKEIQSQLISSKTFIEKKLGVQVKDIAYPFGLYDVRVVKMLKNTGYRMGFTVNLGLNYPGDNPYTLKRYLVTGKDSPDIFRERLHLKKTDVVILPGDGEDYSPGSTIKISIANIQPDSLILKISNREIPLVKEEATKGIYTARLPNIHTKRGFLPVLVLAKNREGQTVTERILYLDRERIKNPLL